ncbi:MAG: hypothetical protein QM719_10415 [Thermomonas sp.]
MAVRAEETLTADLTAIDTLAARMYAAFDNRGGRAPDLDGLREVFLPQCAICKAIPGQEQVQSLDAFIEQRRPLLTQGRLVDFDERETDARTWIDGNTASRRSLYAKSGVLDGVSFRTRGAKQMQLVRLDGRWWIAALAWDDEREGFEPPSSLARKASTR